MNIAIIGSGISGLTAAYHLYRHHRITVFEANENVGGHTNTVDVKLDGQSYSIDTGFIVFNDWTYPNFIQLMKELNVSTQETEMSFSVRDDATGLEYNGHSLNTIFAQRRNLLRPRFYRMVLDIIRFNRQASQIADDSLDSQTVGEFLNRNRYSDEFCNQYLLPMGSAIWSCPQATFGEFPIKFIAAFYKNHGLLNIRNRPTWRVISGGSKSYLAPLCRGFSNRIRLNSPVTGVHRNDSSVDVIVGDAREKFDHVVFACHSDQALKILGANATSTERELLSAFPYTKNVAVLHTDENVLPRTKRAWASWNYRLGEKSDNAASVTYNMSLLQGIKSPHTFCVTLNDEKQIDPKLILGRFVYHHPVFTVQRDAAQSRYSELIDVNRTSFCGAYWRNGFHEDGVVSGMSVAEALNAPGRTFCEDLAKRIHRPICSAAKPVSARELPHNA